MPQAWRREARASCYSTTSRMTSSSTGMPSGKLATPSTMRTDVFSFPKMLSNPIHSCVTPEAWEAIYWTIVSGFTTAMLVAFVAPCSGFSLICAARSSTCGRCFLR